MKKINKVLVVVDMQNDFISGSLGTAEARSIVDGVARKIRARRAEGYTVLVTMDTHGGNYLETQEGRRLPVSHCIKGTEGWRLHPKIAAETVGCKIYEKATFASCDLLAELKKINPDEIEFVGLCTDICVISNALGAKAALPEARISVDGSCTAGVSPESREAALTAMKSCQIDII